MSKKVQVLLLVLLSLISVFFAEVISGSMKYPLFDLWGYFVVIPLYGLHTIMFLFFIKQKITNKKILFSTLYFAGVLFGLYEAYITKVLWIGLAEDSFILLNVSILDYLVLVFFWHPIFSFIIPVLVFEKLITKTDYAYQGLPKFVKSVLSKKYGVLLTMIVVGFFSAFNGMFDTLTLSELSLALPIILIILLIYRKGIHNRYSFDEILPGKKGIIMCIVYLLLIYIGLGIYVKPEVLTISNQLPIWISYLVFGYLFYRKLKKNTLINETESNNTTILFKSIILYTVIILLSGIIFVFILWALGIRDIMIVGTWILWILSGISLLVYSLLN